ncbi:MAG: glycosyltransferase [Chloroflexota bacterium]
MKKKVRSPQDTLTPQTHDQKHILILTADTGLGHRSTAKAITLALEETYGANCTIDTVNPMDHERASVFLRNSQADYDRMVRDLPEIYRFGYKAIDSPLPNAIIESAFTVMLFEAIYDIVKEYRPDVIVDTYESYLAPLDAVFTINRRHIPVITVVTDLATVHRTWFNTVTDLCCVPTQIVFDLAVGLGLAPDKVKVTGIPVNPAFAKETRDPAAIRAELGWRSDLTTVLAVGGTRVNHLDEALNVLNHSGLPLQLIVVAGGDDERYQQFRDTTWHAVTHLYNLVDNMPSMLRAADLVICKAGGLIVTEALACGLPLLLVDLIQGQETGNMDYVVNGGAGEFANTPIEALEIMYHWLDKGGELLAQRAQQARSMGHPRSAYDIAEMIWTLAQSNTDAAPSRSVVSLKTLTELLNNFNVPWGDGGSS